MGNHPSDSPYTDEFWSKWRHGLSRYRRSYWSVPAFITAFRWYTHGLFNLPGQTFTDPGMFVRGLQGRQTWSYFLFSWVWAVAGFFCGSVIGLYAIDAFDLTNDPHVSWFMIGASVLGAFVATGIISLTTMLSTFVANLLVFRRMRTHHSDGTLVVLLTYGIKASMYGVFLGNASGAVIVLGVAIVLLIHIPHNSSLVSVGIVGGVLYKFAGTLLIGVAIPTIKSVASSLVASTIWRFLRGRSNSTSASDRDTSEDGTMLGVPHAKNTKRNRAHAEILKELFNTLELLDPGPTLTPISQRLPGHHTEYGVLGRVASGVVGGVVTQVGDSSGQQEKAMPLDKRDVGSDQDADGIVPYQGAPPNGA